MMRRKMFAVAFLVCSSQVAVATPITFSDRNAFDEVAGIQSILTFEEYRTGPVCPPEPYVPDACVFDAGIATFVSTHSFFERFSPTLTIQRGIGGAVSNGIGAGTWIPRAYDDFYVDFEGQFIGFDIISGGQAPLGIRLTQSDGDISEFIITSSIAPGVFFGAYSATGFSRVSLVANPGGLGAVNFILDNVSIAPIHVDEPACGLGGAAALLMLALLARRKPSVIAP